MPTGYDIAKKYLDLEENKDNYQLIQFFKKYAIAKDIVINPATTPWCAAFVNACEREGGNKGTGRLNARSFLNYGNRVGIEEAQRGDICIFSRGNNTWQGHVTYFDSLDENPRFVKVLGGNQSNKVCYAFYLVKNLLGVRRPK